MEERVREQEAAFAKLTEEEKERRVKAVEGLEQENDLVIAYADLKGINPTSDRGMVKLTADLLRKNGFEEILKGRIDKIKETRRSLSPYAKKEGADSHPPGHRDNSPSPRQAESRSSSPGTQ